MKIKTSELIGAALDWAVAKCEGTENTWGRSRLKPHEFYRGHSYSTDWLQGGPILDREKIGLRGPSVLGANWVAFIDASGCSQGPQNRQVGTTSLIAAMRCYVASKLGDEVEVPDELRAA